MPLTGFPVALPSCSMTFWWPDFVDLLCHAWVPDHGDGQRLPLGWPLLDLDQRAQAVVGLPSGCLGSRAFQAPPLLLDREKPAILSLRGRNWNQTWKTPSFSPLFGFFMAIGRLFCLSYLPRAAPLRGVARPDRRPPCRLAEGPNEKIGPMKRIRPKLAPPRGGHGSPVSASVFSLASPWRPAPC